LELVIDVPKGNILSGAVMRALDGLLAEHASRPELRLVTIRGEGRNFSFGASVEEHRRDSAREMLTTFHALIRRIGSYPVPVATLVEGRCLGGAFEVALAGHFVLATRTAIFGCPEIKLGVFPPVLAALGPARLGAALSERLLLTGAELGVDAALATGFVSAIAPEGVTLEAFARDWYTANLAPLSAKALRHGVRAARTGAQLDLCLSEILADVEAQYLEDVVGSHDGNEGIEAFLARREPVWKHA
jgi:cyclohexa-1,5-dienecarbonyl-CoA hydratase